MGYRGYQPSYQVPEYEALGQDLGLNVTASGFRV